MTVYEVTLRNAVAREKTYRIEAATGQSASNTALKFARQDTGATDWMVARVIEAF